MMAIDYRQEVTDEIIRLIEEGNTPWQKPWNPEVAGKILNRPYNAATGRLYAGGNSCNLLVRQSYIFNSQDPRWCTFKQAQEAGWKIKKGAKAATVEYWKFTEDKMVTDAETGKKEKVTQKLEKPRVFYAHVFHASQIEGIPAYDPVNISELEWNPIKTAETIIKNSGAVIKHDKVDTAYYSPHNDDIHVPLRESFASQAGYYSTVLHELGHWTGHEKRLNRSFGGKIGSVAYAKEELRAEMASLYLSMETGVPFEPEQHAAYEKSWLKVLKDDKNEFFKACRDAEKITEYIMDLSKEKHLENDIVGYEKAAEIDVLENKKELLNKSTDEIKIPEIISNQYKLLLRDMDNPNVDKMLDAMNEYIEFKENFPVYVEQLEQIDMLKKTSKENENTTMLVKSRLDTILKCKESRNSSLEQKYKLAFKKQFLKTGLGTAADEAAVKHLLSQGYNSYNIKLVIMKCSPVIVNAPNRTAYKDGVIKNVIGLVKADEKEKELAR